MVPKLNEGVADGAVVVPKLKRGAAGRAGVGADEARVPNLNVGAAGEAGAGVDGVEKVGVVEGGGLVAGIAPKLNVGVADGVVVGRVGVMVEANLKEVAGAVVDGAEPKVNGVVAVAGAVAPKLNAGEGAGVGCSPNLPAEPRELKLAGVGCAGSADCSSSVGCADSCAGSAGLLKKPVAGARSFFDSDSLLPEPFGRKQLG